MEVDTSGRTSQSHSTIESTSSSPRIFPGFLSAEDPDQSSESSSTLPQHGTSRKQPPKPLNLDTDRRDDQTIPSSGLFYGPSSSRSSASIRKRPSPLQLSKARAVGLDEELEAQRSHDEPLTSITVISDSSDSLHDQMDDLSLLRHSVRQNLIARPVDSPLAPSESGGSSGPLTPEYSSSSPVSEEETISIDQVCDLLQSASMPHLPLTKIEKQTAVLDTRPLGDFLQAHLPRSSNVSIPSLIFKRFKRSIGTPTSWDSLGSFVSTPAGKDVWEGVNPREPVEIIVIGSTSMDEPARVLKRILAGIMDGNVRILKGGWVAVLDNPRARELLVQGEQSVKSMIIPRTAGFVPPPLPKEKGSRITHHPSLPSLRPPRGKPNLPTLSTHGLKRPPKLSLNLDKSSKSTADVSTLGVPSQSSGPRSPLTSSFQALCHEQSILPPSPSSFRGAERHNQDEPSHPTPNSDRPTVKPDGRYPQSAFPPLTTARSNGLNPFIVSTILPGFLYLGPEISSDDDVEELKQLGIKRILNVAIECDNEDLNIVDRFERYLKLPMRDIVEETGVGDSMREACKFMDDARLHSHPTYVHCKAGKSRSVTVVLAYLIHANAWTLKTAYAYVAERRKGISPNIGFVAELMQFEASELGLRQSSGVHGEVKSEKQENKQSKPKSGPRHARESLPPAWSSSLDSGPRSNVSIKGETRDGEGFKKDVGDEREVRKNGQWVHQRRAPVDRTTLQPGRRVSKAGLESLMPLSTTSRSGPSPNHSVEGGDKPLTPGGEGRIGWV